MDQPRKDNITVWEHYSQKLHQIEQNLDKTKAESSSDVNVIKLEFERLRELYGKLKSCCDQSVSVLRSEEIESRSSCYTLESAGGQVISTRCTQRYNMNTRAFKLLGVTLFYESNNPRTVIQGNSLQPEVCWAFQDFPGYLLIKLRSFIRVTGFTLEHVPRSLLPNSEMRSAPRKFNVWGLKDENDVEPIMLGDYECQESEESLQYFSLQNIEITEAYEFIELRIHSNNGQVEYTCLHKFRVHRIPV